MFYLKTEWTGGLAQRRSPSTAPNFWYNEEEEGHKQGQIERKGSCRGGSCALALAHVRAQPRAAFYTPGSELPNIWLNQDASPTGFLEGIFSRVEGDGRTKKGNRQRKIWPQIKCLYPTLLHPKLEDKPFIAPGRRH